MPTLIKPANDDVNSAWEIDANAASPDWTDIDSFTSGAALELSVDAEVVDAFAQATHIAVNFPAFNDGRGLSLGVLLRRSGFTGPLRATGAIHEDIVHYLVRCGFNEIEIPEDRDPQVALALLKPYSDFYQGSAVTPSPAFRRVSRGESA